MFEREALDRHSLYFVPPVQVHSDLQQCFMENGEKSLEKQPRRAFSDIHSSKVDRQSTMFI